MFSAFTNYLGEQRTQVTQAMVQDLVSGLQDQQKNIDTMVEQVIATAISKAGSEVQSQLTSQTQQEAVNEFVNSLLTNLRTQLSQDSAKAEGWLETRLGRLVEGLEHRIKKLWQPTEHTQEVAAKVIEHTKAITFTDTRGKIYPYTGCLAQEEQVILRTCIEQQLLLAPTRLQNLSTAQINVVALGVYNGLTRLLSLIEASDTESHHFTLLAKTELNQTADLARSALLKRALEKSLQDIVKTAAFTQANKAASLQLAVSKDITVFKKSKPEQATLEKELVVIAAPESTQTHTKSGLCLMM